MVVIQSECSSGYIGIIDYETLVTWNHSGVACGSFIDFPSGIVATVSEVGARIITQNIAIGICEDIISIHNGNIPIHGGVSSPVGRNGFHFLVVEDAGDQNAFGFASGSSPHHIVLIFVAIETSGKDHLGSNAEGFKVGKADEFATRNDGSYILHEHSNEGHVFLDSLNDIRIIAGERVSSFVSPV